MHPKKYGHDSLPMIDALRRKEVHAILISRCNGKQIRKFPVI